MKCSTKPLTPDFSRPVPNAEEFDSLDTTQKRVILSKFLKMQDGKIVGQQRTINTLRRENEGLRNLVQSMLVPTMYPAPQEKK